MFRLPMASKTTIWSWSAANSSSAKDLSLAPKRQINEPHQSLVAIPCDHADPDARALAGRYASDTSHAAHGRSERYDPHRDCGGAVSGRDIGSGGEPTRQEDRRSQGEDVFDQPSGTSVR